MFSLGAPQSELTPSLNDAGFVHSGSMGAWHALRWSSRGDKLVLELVLWPITMQPPHASEREGRDARGLSGARATKFNSSNIATWRVYNSVKHGSWLAGCESSCHGSKRYTLYLMLDRERW